METHNICADEWIAYFRDKYDLSDPRNSEVLKPATMQRRIREGFGGSIIAGVMQYNLFGRDI